MWIKPKEAMIIAIAFRRASTRTARSTGSFMRRV
jgi:hypothetical protein